MLARSLKHLGTRSSCLALIGASAVLLAATGESMWHAQATALEGRWAGPGVGISGAETSVGTASAHIAASPSSIAHESAEAFSLTTCEARAMGSGGSASNTGVSPTIETLFKPFVLVRIPYDQST